MPNANKLIENLRKYAATSNRMSLSERNRIHRKIMHEISDKNYDKIKKWMSSAEGKELSFDDLFKGKTRAIIPFSTSASAMGGKIGDIVELFEKNGWDIDLATGTAQKEVEYEIPKGPKAGEKIKKKENQKIGKLLGLLQDLYDKNKKQTKIAAEVGATGKKLYTSNEYMQAVKSLDDAEKRLKKAFPKTSESMENPGYRWIIWTINLGLDLVKFWNEKSEYYRKNPDFLKKEASQYSIIISRHPIDVLRMSDFKDIQSCHTQGHEYFQCAIHEAKGHGPIAYLVNTADLKGINLEDEEIFADQARSIPGITPISRVRLRKYVDSDEGWEVAAPELRVYGNKMPGFQETVSKWVRKNQPSISMEDVSQSIAEDSLVRYGGSYGDNTDGSIFNHFFPEANGNFGSKNVDTNSDGEDEEEEANEDLWDQMQQEADAIQNSADRYLEHISISHNVDGDDGVPYVYFSGQVEFDLIDALGEERGWDEDDVISTIVKVAEKFGLYLNDDRDSWARVAPKEDHRFIAEISAEAFELSPDGFFDFFESLKGPDDNYDDMIKAIGEALEDDGVISPTLSPEELGKIHRKLAALENVRTIVEGPKFTIVSRKPIQLDNNIKKWQRMPKEALESFQKKYEEVVKKNIEKRVMTRIADNIKWRDKGTSEPIRQMYGLNIGIDGVSFKFLESYEALNLKQDIMNIEEFISTVDANYEVIENTAREVFELLTDKYAEELAGQMKLPLAAESKVPSHDKLFENWRKFLV